MPHSMPFSEQSNKWFSVMIFIGLPFLVIYRWAKGELPYLENEFKKKIK